MSDKMVEEMARAIEPRAWKAFDGYVEVFAGALKGYTADQKREAFIYGSPLVKGHDWGRTLQHSLEAAQAAATIAERRMEEMREALEKLNAHVEAMQEMATRYLVPEAYKDRDGVVWSDGDPEPFASDLIWMLDGPEQREAQGKARAALRPSGGVSGMPQATEDDLGKVRGNAITDRAHLAILKLHDFAEAVPEHSGGCPWCSAKDHWAGRVEMCPAPSSEAIAAALRASTKEQQP